MKLSTALLTATAFAGVVAATSTQANATLLATVTYHYNTNDTVTAFLKNNTSGSTETSPMVFGVALVPAPIAPGGTASGNIGDVDDITGATTISASFSIGGTSFSGTFPIPANIRNDEYGTNGTIGTISGTVPEPATLAVLGSALLGLGAARRRKH